jgi:hypothetical protein
MLGATDDWAQCRATVALIAIAQGDIGLAERILDELGRDEKVQSVLGGGAISYLCGRAELLLARGEIAAGLGAYDAAADQLARQEFTQFELPGGVEPWVLFPRAAALAAHCRYGAAAAVRDARDELRGKARSAIENAAAYLDHPIIGSVLFALGTWEVRCGDPALARRLVDLAEAFTFNRMLPSLDPAWVAPLLPPGDEWLDVPREGLREEAARLLAQIG